MPRPPSEEPEGMVLRSDYESRRPQPGEPIPEWIEPVRLRFQRGTGDGRRVWEVTLEPRSGYVLAGEARRSWQHSIPPTKEERHSITFRALRRR